MLEGQKKGGQKGGGDRKSEKYKKSKEEIESEADPASKSVGDGKNKKAWQRQAQRYL